MSVERRVHQPFGLLHGGASVALAESVASIAASLNIDRARFMAVGLELNAAITQLYWTQVSLILLVIIGTVILSEWVSAKVRHAII